MGKKSTAAIYGAVHFLVDLGCAFFVFRIAEKIHDFYIGYLLYNFLAFALQMPVGLIADRLKRNSLTASLGCVLVGSALFCATAAEMMRPQIAMMGLFFAGIGNCLFHVGGGIEVMRQSEGKASPLGIFVSPGAIGIFLGTLLGKREEISVILGVIPLFLTAAGLVLWEDRRIRKTVQCEKAGTDRKWALKDSDPINNKGSLLSGRSPLAVSAMCCFFLVVVFRSYLGMIAVFPWKRGLLAGMICLLAVVGGKIAGGFLADKIGVTRAIGISMAVAAVLFTVSDQAVFGILALLCFNMSMPVTLYLAAKIFKDHPGFAFGLLTFAIFLGFLPAYAGYTDCSNKILAVLAVSSLVVMMLGIYLYGKWKMEQIYE